MKTVSFSFATEEERADFAEYARAKGMTLSALAKMAVYQYRSKYPHQTRKKASPLRFNTQLVESGGGVSIAPKTVQPYEPTANGEIGTE